MWQWLWFYQILATFINSIDIGVFKDINDFNDTDIPCEGLYRNLPTYALRLNEFYLRVNFGRVDKLQFFASEKTDPRSKVFPLSIGGERAPLVSTSFLSQCCQESYQQFQKLSDMWRRWKRGFSSDQGVTKLVQDLQFIESQTFEDNVVC